MSAQAQYDARITSLTGDGTQIVTLDVEPGYQFRAGQYLNVITPEGFDVPLSIASSPTRLPVLELHYRSTPDLSEAAALDNALAGTSLRISAAEGDVRAGAPHQRVLIVAGGTGAAQAFSCAEYRHATRAGGDATIVWCADDEDQLYETERLASYGVTLHTIVDDRRTAENEGLAWLREHGGHFAASGDDDAYVLLAGGPPFVYAALDVLLETGIRQAQCHADVFSYAPRH